MSQERFADIIVGVKLKQEIKTLENKEKALKYLIAYSDNEEDSIGLIKQLSVVVRKIIDLRIGLNNV